MAGAIVHHLLHPLTCEGESQITKRHLLFSLGVTFVEFVFTSWAAWPNSWSPNYQAAFFIGSCTVITFYACTAVFKTYVYTGDNTNQNSADAGCSSERSVTQISESAVTRKTQEETVPLNQQAAQLKTEISELSEEVKTTLAKIKEYLPPISQSKDSANLAQIVNAYSAYMRCSELVVELEQKGTIDQKVNKIQTQIEKLQTQISKDNRNKLIVFLEYLGLFH